MTVLSLSRNVVVCQANCYFSFKVVSRIVSSDCSDWSVFFMGMYFGRCAPGLYTRIFVISHQHLIADLECNVKHFANDTSLLTVVYEPNAASENIEHDLALEIP